MIRTHEEHLAHYGILRKSGRYPWGSGDSQSTRNRDYLDYIANLKKQGMTEAEIAKGLNITRMQLTAARSDALAQQRREKQLTAQRLQEKGMSKSAIGRQMGLNESSVRALLAPGAADKNNALQVTTDMVKSQVDAKRMVDVGVGVEHHVGVTRSRLDTAVAILKERGYKVHTIYVRQINMPGKFTPMKVLTLPGITKQEVERNRKEIKQITDFSTDQGRSFLGIQPPLSVSSRRIAVTYGPDGGANLDGVMYVRPGVKDLSIGSSRYGQVRVMVNNTHYLKGMAVYKEDLPDGVDIVFNTKKHDTGRKLDAMKELEPDPDNPFGSIVRQVTDPKTGKVTSAMNLVGSPAREGSGEEGSWDSWSKSLSSQMLSKQDPKLAKQQLNLTYENRKKELAEIQSLTNPTVKRELLIKFSDATDSAAVHLQAANMPRQQTKVLLPMNSIKRDEVYAPTFNDGERVVLVRHPHGGPFEIPELVVNNRNREARRIMGTSAQDAIGIHHSVAQRLSGADFDGDTVLVIPNDKRQVKWEPALEGLKTFDPMIYKIPEGSNALVMTAARKQPEMGKISNLITDMTILGANNSEKAQALRHSMVVIDAANHKLDFIQSEKDNGIRNLKAKYQGGKNAGATTLISRAGSDKWILDRRERSPKFGGPIDPVTGKRAYEETGKMRKVTRKQFDPITGRTKRVPTGDLVRKEIKVKRLSVTDDARLLSTGTEMETIYALHSNKLKAMANEARREALTFKDTPKSKSAAKVYANEVASLNAKLNVALKNAPLERQAQLLANASVSQKRQANPGMDEKEVTKINQLALYENRIRTGAGKKRINITQSEWDAIQAAAVSPTQLKKILLNADVDRVKALALPKDVVKMTSAKMLRAQSMLASGYTQAEVAAALGVGLTTLKVSLNE